MTPVLYIAMGIAIAWIIGGFVYMALYDANGNRRMGKDDDMTKEQKTMTGLKCCWALFSGVEGEPMCSRCPYFDPDFEDNDNNMTCIAELMEDAMDTIKTAKD